MLFIVPIFVYVTYKFIGWYRYSRYLKGIVKFEDFSKLQEYINRCRKREFLFSIYSSIGASGPLLESKINSSGDDFASFYKSVDINHSLHSGYLAVESTNSLLFQSVGSVDGVVSSIVSRHFNSLPSYLLDDGKSKLQVINDNGIQFPLEKTISMFKNHVSEDSNISKIIDFVIGKKNCIGHLIEERVMKPNARLFTIVSCTLDSTRQKFTCRIPNLPFQFSESKLNEEISKSEYKTLLYGGFLCGFGVSFLVYYGVPYVRNYLYKLKLDKTITSTPEQMDRICAVCYENSRDIIFIPCNHVLTCNGCSSHLTTCPLCRCQISSKRRLLF